MLKKTIMTAAAFILAAAALTSCGGKDAKNTGSDALGDSYPLSTNETLTWWSWWPTHTDYASYKEQPFFKELMKETGVTINFKCDQTPENFNLMLASNDFPDIVSYNWLQQPGGMDYYIDTNVVADVTELIDKYAPNLKKIYDENPEIAKQARTDKGRYYGFPTLREDEWLTVFRGMIVRKDLLDEYNIAEPETIDDWTNMLTVFKKNGVVAPLSLNDVQNIGEFMYAYNISDDFYLDDGKVKYGPNEKSYRDCVEQFAKWYADGLLDKDFGTVDAGVLNGKMTSGMAAASVANAGAGMGVWLPAGKAINEKYDLVGVKYPVLERGTKPEFGQKGFMLSTDATAVITSQCKNKELAARVLDFGYSEQGHLLYNFGIEGESYNMVDGKPVFSDEIKNYPGGDMTASLSRYIMGISNGPFVLDKSMYEQRLVYDEQKEAIDNWSDTNMDTHLLPPLTPTAEESSEFVSIMNNVRSYVNETRMQFILGKKPMSDFDSYYETLKTMGIDRAIEIEQTVYERYKDR